MLKISFAGNHEPKPLIERLSDFYGENLIEASNHELLASIKQMCKAIEDSARTFYISEPIFELSKSTRQNGDLIVTTRSLTYESASELLDAIAHVTGILQERMNRRDK